MAWIMRAGRLVDTMRLGLLLILVAGEMLRRATGCFDRHKDIALCMRKNNISIPIFRGPSGFDFGWGSVDETEEMCRTRGHIRTLTCMKLLVNDKCRGNSAHRLRRLLLDAVFEVRPYIRAADYLCHDENMRIFNENRDCLKRHETNAESCSKQKARSMEDAMRDLKKKAETGTVPSEAKPYKDFVYKIMYEHQCMGQIGSMRCIFYELSKYCDRRIVLLLMNYYKELLPDTCKLTFDYEAELRISYEPRHNDEARPSSNMSRVYEVRDPYRLHSPGLRPSYLLTFWLAALGVWRLGAYIS